MLWKTPRPSCPLIFTKPVSIWLVVVRSCAVLTNDCPRRQPWRFVSRRIYSEDSGITQPQNNIYKKTLVNTAYNALDLDRYLMCDGVWHLNDVADDAPYDAIVIICNSEKYGGGGIYNFYCTVYNHGEYPDYVIVHEMGHLIGGLGDEYYLTISSVCCSEPAR